MNESFALGKSCFTHVNKNRLIYKRQFIIVFKIAYLSVSCLKRTSLVFQWNG